MNSRSSENNVEKFEYHSNSGVIFRCGRSDFAEPIKVFGIPLNLDVLLGAVSEMIAFHRAEIWPYLNGFAGYDAIHFEKAGENDLQTESDSYSGWTKEAGQLKVGDYIVIHRGDGKQAVEIVDVDSIDGRIYYKMLTGNDEGKRFGTRFDALQNIRVFETPNGAIESCQESEQ